MSETTLEKKKKNRSQFSPEERVHLMKIMEEYATRLADKKLSTLVRKEIWSTIEGKFNDGNFQERNAAQLKKYWQNFKYHSKRTKLSQNTEDLKTEKAIKEEKVFPENWHQYCIDFDLDMLTNPKSSSRQSQQEVQPAPKLDDLTKFNTDSALSKVNQNASVKSASLDRPLDLSTKKIAHDQAKNFDASGFNKGTSQATILLSDLKLEKIDENCLADNENLMLQSQIGSSENKFQKYNVVVSNSKITNNKVVVSLIRPRSDTESSKNKHTSLNISPPSVISNSEGSKFVRIGPGSPIENYEELKLKMFESLKRSASQEFNDCNEKNSPVKSARVTFSSKDKNKFETIKKIPENACVIRRIRNIVHEKVVDKEMKVEPSPLVGCSTVSTKKIDKDLETVRIKIKDNTETPRTLENSFGSGLNHFPDEEITDEIKVEDVLATSHLKQKEKSSDIFVKFEWDHRLLLRQLETKELLLKLEIAETAIQEIRLRILAMDKDLKHKTELQDLMHKLQKNLPSNFENSP